MDLVDVMHSNPVRAVLFRRTRQRGLDFDKNIVLQLPMWVGSETGDMILLAGIMVTAVDPRPSTFAAVDGGLLRNWALAILISTLSYSDRRF